ncbi:right-handed parallel beta-helix repeat-containing protein [Listeria booriae]|uniref:right-handed parallel beta-helix repeat-containing protein n=1 Tax=Listeria booriae TaxID=1552123 RepID=UPI001628F795|nr:right-handed parallel beta-helix repeat-containing protein [Listeria booriae]MBC1576095.1 right-handed parallel beta-helix repeat-containing protein [Listeria booriae]
MKKWILMIGLLIVLECISTVHPKAATEIDIKPLIEKAGTGVLVLEDRKDITYIVNEPIKDVKCSIQGAPNGSYIRANFEGAGNTQTPFLLRYLGGIKDISISNITFDLNLIGRGSVHFYKNTNVTVENCFFTGYSKTFGYNTADSSIAFTDCSNVEVRNNNFFNNGHQYGKNTNELNRCVTIQGNSGDSYAIHDNDFTRVNQGVVIQGDNISKLDIYNNAFNAIVDNSLYLLKIPVANIDNNTFNKNQTTDSPDEGIVLAGGQFKITNNQVYNVLNKFIAINGEIEKLEVTNNSITNKKTTSRPAVIAWRNNTAYTVKKLDFSKNKLDIDTAPANYDVIPIGRTQLLTIKENQFILSALADYQHLFSLLGETPIERVEITGNNITTRSNNDVISPKSLFLREKAPILPEIGHLLIANNQFKGKYPDILKATSGEIRPADYSNTDSYVVGSYSGDITKAQLLVNGISKSWGGTFKDGIFQYYLGANTYKNSDKLELVAYDIYTKELDRKIIPWKKTLPSTLLVNTYQLSDVTITGKYEGDITKARVYVNGVAQAWGGTFQNNMFSYYIGLGKIRMGDSVYIVGYNYENVELARQFIKF